LVKILSSSLCINKFVRVIASKSREEFYKCDANRRKCKRNDCANLGVYAVFHYSCYVHVIDFCLRKRYLPLIAVVFMFVGISAPFYIFQSTFG